MNKTQITKADSQKIEHLESWSGLTVEGWQQFGKEYFRFHIDSSTVKTCSTYDGAKQFAVGVEFGRKLGST